MLRLNHSVIDYEKSLTLLVQIELSQKRKKYTISRSMVAQNIEWMKHVYSPKERESGTTTRLQ